MEKDYSKYITGKSTIDHKQRVSMNLSNDEYVLIDAIGTWISNNNTNMSYKDYFEATGFYPEEVRELLYALKQKKLLATVDGIIITTPLFIKNKLSKNKKATERKIFFSESEIYDKAKFKEKFKDWNKEKIEYYWNSADTWSGEGGKKIDWARTIMTWERRDAAVGKLKFINKEKEQENKEINFFANR